jgi:hypothetical protein
VDADENGRDLEDNNGDNADRDKVMTMTRMTMTTGMATTTAITKLSLTSTMRQRG